jgi:hypothetical protein
MATGAKFVTADEAMVIAARAMDAIPFASPEMGNARAVYSAAAQVRAGCEVARGSIQVDDRIPVPDYLYNDFGGEILSRKDA